MTACTQKGEVKKMTNIDISSFDLSNFSVKSIYFGHMSVGNNIIDGMATIIEQKGQSDIVKILRIENVDKINGHGFYHSTIGKNLDPISKIDAFKNKIIDQRIGKKVDIAFFKFCFVDINKDTDINEVFSEYVNCIEEINEQYPELKILHVTCPLKYHLHFGNIKAGNLNKTLRKFARFGVNLFTGDQDNIKRNEYNRLVVDKYGKSDYLFDLAKFESTTKNGGQTSFIYKDKKYLCLNDEYTQDGGHLDELGKIVIGKKMLEYLTAIKGSIEIEK